MTSTPRPVQRIVTSVLAGGRLVVGAALTAAPTGGGSAGLSTTYDAQARERAATVAEREPHEHRAGAPATTALDGHVHGDPTTKNALSRSGEAAAHPARTTARQRAESRGRVASQRTLREPRLIGVPLREWPATRAPRAR